MAKPRMNDATTTQALLSVKGRLHDVYGRCFRDVILDLAALKSITAGICCARRPRSLVIDCHPGLGICRSPARFVQGKETILCNGWPACLLTVSARFWSPMPASQTVVLGSRSDGLARAGSFRNSVAQAGRRVPDESSRWLKGQGRIYVGNARAACFVDRWTWRKASHGVRVALQNRPPQGAQAPHSSGRTCAQFAQPSAGKA